MQHFACCWRYITFGMILCLVDATVVQSVKTCKFTGGQDTRIRVRRQGKNRILNVGVTRT